jgi:hypothetical protein
MEPEPEAPEEAAMKVVEEPAPAEAPAESEEDISLEAIVEELKRREGRS